MSIEGTQPLLWHHFGPDAIPLGPKAKTGKAGNDPEEWRKTVLATQKGQLYLKREYVSACLRGGAKYTSRKRGTLQPYVAATVRVLDERVLTDRWMPKDPKIDAETDLVYIDRRGVVNPGTDQRNIRYRIAASAGWKAEFTLAWDNTVVGVNEMEAVVRDAGKLVGIGSGRVIGLGRFEVKSFDAKETNATDSATSRNLGKNARKGVAAGRR